MPLGTLSGSLFEAIGTKMRPRWLQRSVLGHWKTDRKKHENHANEKEIVQGYPTYPRPPSYPGRATPAHPPSRVSAKAMLRFFTSSLLKLCVESLLILCVESLLKVCVRVSTKLDSFCAHTPDRRISNCRLNLFGALP